MSDTKIYLENMGYTVKILNLVDPKNSDRFYGLDGALEEPIFVSNIVEAAIANSGGGKGDHFFDAAEGNLLSALIFLQMESETGELPTIKGAYQTILSISSVNELNDIFDELPPDSRGRRSYNLFRMASPNVQGNVIIGLGARLSVLQNDEIAELMSYPDMDILSLGKEKTAYFLVLSDQDTTMRFVSAMFFSLLFMRLVQYADSLPDRRLPIPVNLVLDELCSVVGAIKDFHIKLSNVRSRSIHISYFFQALGQLQNRYPDNMWSEVLSAADTTLIMGCNDSVSAEYVSERSGEVTIYADTVMKQRNIFMPAMLQPKFRHSEGTGRRKLLTLDEVLRMDHKDMLVMLRGQQVLQIEKFDYTRNPESTKFRPVPIKGLRDVPQCPATPITNSPIKGYASKPLGAAPNHYTEPTQDHAPSTTANSNGKEVVPSVTDMQRPGADYSGPSFKQSSKPGI